MFYDVSQDKAVQVSQMAYGVLDFFYNVETCYIGF